LVGKSVAATLAHYYAKALIHVNHIHGHIVSLLLERSISSIKLPLVVLSVSGGHNDLYLVRDARLQGNSSSGEQLGPFHITKLGKTLDDAAGEAFDKVSRML